MSDPRVATLEKLLQAAGYQLAAPLTRAPTAAAVAQSTLEQLTAARPDGQERAFRSLLVLSDALAGSVEPIRVALTVTPAALTGDARFDAAVAGLIEHHLALAQLLRPPRVGA